MRSFSLKKYIPGTRTSACGSVHARNSRGSTYSSRNIEGVNSTVLPRGASRDSHDWAGGSRKTEIAYTLHPLRLTRRARSSLGDYMGTELMKATTCKHGSVKICSYTITTCKEDVWKRFYNNTYDKKPRASWVGKMLLYENPLAQGTSVTNGLIRETLPNWTWKLLLYDIITACACTKDVVKRVLCDNHVANWTWKTALIIYRYTMATCQQDLD